MQIMEYFSMGLTKENKGVLLTTLHAQHNGGCDRHIMLRITSDGTDNYISLRLCAHACIRALGFQKNIV